MQSLVVKLKVAAAVGRPIDEPSQRFRKLVRGIHVDVVKSPIGTLEQVAQLSKSERCRIAAKCRRLMNDIETGMNEIDDSLQLAKAKAACKEEWFADLETLKYGSAALRRAKHVTPDFDVDYSAVAVLDDLRRLFIHEEDALALGASLDIAPDGTGSDLLHSIGIEGILIRCQRPQAAVVNPWMIVVDIVSSRRQSTALAVTALDCGLVQDASDCTLGAQEEEDVIVEDVLVVCDPRNASPYSLFSRSKLHSMCVTGILALSTFHTNVIFVSISSRYLSVIFTRTPTVPLPAQRLALLMVGFVRAVEQVFFARAQCVSHLFAHTTPFPLAATTLQASRPRWLSVSTDTPTH